MRHVFSSMGTVVSLNVADADPALLDRIESVFAAADARFSLYRDDSELSRINHVGGSFLDAGPELWAAYALAADWRARTNGFFTPTRPDGRTDLNGVVKAIAMREAGVLLGEAGHPDWTLVVGGDMLASGADPSGGPWITGVIDPLERIALLCAIELRDPHRAVATSGSAERGDHIWGAMGASEFVQVTVMARDIVTADVLATAIIAGGERILQDASEQWPVDILTVDGSGELRATPGFRIALAIAGD